jgi:type I restriction enzyme S subunit
MSLPPDWKWQTMGEISQIIGGGTPKTNEQDNFEGGNIPWLTPADMSGYKDKFVCKGARSITEKGLKTSSARMLPAGSILFTSRAPIGYVAIASNDISTNQGFKSFVLKNSDIIPDYVYWWLKGNKQLAESLASGTTFLELSGEKAKKLPIPIAPLDQQKQIVAKIEELFSHIDAGVVALQKAKQLLKQYRQSVLKAAVTGELTKEWREQNQDKLEPASELLTRILDERRRIWEEQQLEHFKAQGKVPKDDKWKENYRPPVSYNFNGQLPEIPREWEWVSPEQIAHIDDYSLSIGPFGSNLKVSDYKESGVPLVFVRNIRSHYYGNDNSKYVSIEKAKELHAHSVEAGDLLITKMGEPPGDASIYPINSKMAIITADCIKWRISSQIKTSSLFVHTINSSFIRDQIVERTKGVAQKKISLGTFRTIAFPLPPFEEQQEISNLVEQKLIACKRLIESLESRLIQAEKNKQSILASAFSGKLTSSDME